MLFVNTQHIFRIQWVDFINFKVKYKDYITYMTVHLSETECLWSRILGCNIRVYHKLQRAWLFWGCIEMTSCILKNSLWGYSPVLWMYTNWSFSPCSHSQWSLANTLSEVFEISVVTTIYISTKMWWERGFCNLLIRPSSHWQNNLSSKIKTQITWKKSMVEPRDSLIMPECHLV